MYCKFDFVHNRLVSLRILDNASSLVHSLQALFMTLLGMLSWKISGVLYLLINICNASLIDVFSNSKSIFSFEKIEL
jgi:hypothetical protein